MAHKKSGGSGNQQVRTAGKRLGLKVSDGQKVTAGTVILKQRGTKYNALEGVGVGRDHTLFALKEGKVKFGKKLDKTTVKVITK